MTNERNNPPEGTYEHIGQQRNGTYSYIKDGILVTRKGTIEVPADPKTSYFHSQLQAMIEAKPFVCVGAKSAFHRKTYRLALYPALGDVDATRQLHQDLCNYGAERLSLPGPYRTFIAIFEGPYYADEPTFEAALWNQLQLLHELDATEHEWDPMTSNDPASDQFSFSVGGTSFFLVAMHPASSRLTRKFIVPAIAFNAHDQFEELRAMGIFSRVAATNRERDIALQGSINPNLADYGHGLEAKQYSGRANSSGWVCPFHVVKNSKKIGENDE